MKEEMAYRCEICKKLYSNIYDATHCENRHEVPEIERTIYEPWSTVPDVILVKDRQMPCHPWRYELVYSPTPAIKRILNGLNPFKRQKE